MQILQIKREELVKQGLVLIRGSYPLFSTLLNLSNVVFLSVFCSFTLYHQVYSNTRVPTRVNTNQHGSDTSRHESTQINTSPTRATRFRHESTRLQYESTRSSTSPKQVQTMKKRKIWLKEKTKRNLTVVWKTAFIRIQVSS